jgi:hypothetical protein
MSNNFLTANISGLEMMQPFEEPFGFHVNRVAAVLNGDNPIPLIVGSLTIQSIPGLNFNYAAIASGSGAAPTLPANTPTGATGGTGKWIKIQILGVTTYILGWQ